ncbi:MAG: NTP transferase domain-containing protein [Candidatus Velthaea sp.]
MYAVITAGGSVAGDFARAIGTDIKALAPLGSGRLIDPAIEAARAAGVSAIAVIGPGAVRDYCGARVERVLAAAADGAENIKRALHAFPAAERLVFLTSDMPFVDAQGLRGFVERSSDFALTMALSPAGAYAAQFPGAPPHLVRFGAHAFANGSAFVIDRSALAALERVAGRFFAARKSLPRLAALLGPTLCLRFALRRLRIADIERRAADVLGVDTRAILDAAPGLCFDVDDLADWNYAQSRLRHYG